MDPWQECSIKLIETGELDPVYNVLAHAREHLGIEWCERFAIGHLMFYSVRTSVTLADIPSDRFWERVLASYHRWQRGQERRHYRGNAGLDSIHSLMQVGSPEEAFRHVTSRTIMSIYKQITTTYRGFGLYTFLKWADFIDVLYKGEVDYTQLPKYLFDGAAKGLESIWPGRNPAEALEEVREFISDLRDPFQGYRSCGNSEAETIACAYRTYYVKTTYKFGWDINNLRTTLATHESPNAKCLLAGVPKQVEGW